MKVIILHNFYVSKVPSGENEVVVRELNDLNSSGFSVTANLISKESDALMQMNFMKKFIVLFRNILLGKSSFTKEELQEIRNADLVHFHNTFPFIGFRIFRQLRDIGIPMVMTIHNSRLDCLNGGHYYKNESCFKCSSSNFFFPGIIRSCYRENFVESLFFSRYMRRLNKEIVFIDAFIVLNQYSRIYLKKLGISDKKIFSKFTPSVRRLPMVDHGEKLVLYAGRISIEKGVELLISSWIKSDQYLNGWKLVLVGSGKYANSIDWNSLVQYGISYEGKVDSMRVEELIRQSHVVAVPSLGFEGFPSMISMASSYGKRIFATNTSFFQGLKTFPWVHLINPEIDDWAKAFNSLHASDSSDVATKAIAWWEANASSQENIKNILTVYSRMIENMD